MKPRLDIETLTAYALGELEPEKAQAVEEALKTAPEARKTLEELDATAALARSALQTAPQTAALTDRQRATVMEQADSPAHVKTAARSNVFRHVFAPKTAAGALARAAAMLLCLAGLYWVANRALIGQPEDRLARRDIEISYPQMLDTASHAEPAPAEPDEQARPAGSVSDADDADAFDWNDEDWGDFETVPGSSASAAAPAIEDAASEAPAEALEPEPETEPEPVSVAQAAPGDSVALPLELPEESFMGTPIDYWSEHLEFTYKPREPFMVPAGTELLSLGKPVTSSDPTPSMGTLAMITNGQKGFEEKNLVELAKGHQWVQIDLGQPCRIHAIVVWHYHMTQRIYFDVSVHLADDADFTQNVRTLFNNDYDNSSGLGAGQDKEYIESNEGRLIDGHGEIARYVRLYSNGNTGNERNHYVEVEVWGLPGEGDSAAEGAEEQQAVGPARRRFPRRSEPPRVGEEAGSQSELVELPLELPEESFLGPPL